MAVGGFVRSVLLMLTLVLCVGSTAAIAAQDIQLQDDATATLESASDPATSEPPISTELPVVPTDVPPEEPAFEVEEVQAAEIEVPAVTALVPPQLILIDPDAAESNDNACVNAGISSSSLRLSPVTTGVWGDGDQFSIDIVVHLDADPAVIRWTLASAGPVLAVIVSDAGADPVPANLFDYRGFGGTVAGDAGLNSPNGDLAVVFICYEDVDADSAGTVIDATNTVIPDLPPVNLTTTADDPAESDSVGIAAIEVNRYVRNSVRLNLRTGPTTSATVAGVLPINTMSSVIGGPQTASGYTWWQLQTPLGQGWAAGAFLVEVAAASATPSPAPAGGIVIGDTLRVATGLNLRSSPTTSASIVALMPTGTLTTVLGGPQSAGGYTWWRLSTPYGTGWAAGQFLTKVASAASATPTKTPTVTATSTTTFTPTLTSTPVPTSTPTATNTQTGTPTPTATSTPTVTGTPPTLTPTSSATPSTCGSFTVGHTVRTTTGLNLRATPTTSGSIIALMATGTRGVVIGGPISANGFTWCRLQTGLGTGWAASTYLAWVSGPPASSPTPGGAIALYQSDSSIRGIAPLPAEVVFAALSDTVPVEERAEFLNYLRRLSALCDTLGLDFVLMAAQWDLETDTGRSSWWRERKNPAGIGVTGNPAQNEASQTWPDGESAAYGHVAHMVAYVWGTEWETVWPDGWPSPLEADQRFNAPIEAGYRAETLSDLNNTWAIDPERNYDGKLAARANRIVENAGSEDDPA